MPRIMHDIEKRYLTLGAQGLIYTSMWEEKISPEVAEIAIDEAVNLGKLNNFKIDEDLMRALISLAEFEKNGIDDQVFSYHGVEASRSIC